MISGNGIGGFFKKFGKPLLGAANVGTSFIPGVGPVAGGLMRGAGSGMFSSGVGNLFGGGGGGLTDFGIPDFRVSGGGFGGGYGGGGGGNTSKKTGKPFWKTPIAATIAGALLSGIGRAVAAGQERKGAREVAELEKQRAIEVANINNLGPVRGGSVRAGNYGRFGFDPEVLARLGSALTPLNPNYRPEYPGSNPRYV